VNLDDDDYVTCSGSVRKRRGFDVVICDYVTNCFTESRACEFYLRTLTKFAVNFSKVGYNVISDSGQKGYIVTFIVLIYWLAIVDKLKACSLRLYSGRGSLLLCSNFFTFNRDGLNQRYSDLSHTLVAV